MKLTLEQHEFDVLKEMITERLNSLKQTIAKNSDKLDEYESNIKNYTTYDLHRKLMEVKWCLKYHSPIKNLRFFVIT